MCGQPQFFDIGRCLKRLSDLGDWLEAFVLAVDFEAEIANLEAEADALHEQIVEINPEFYSTQN